MPADASKGNACVSGAWTFLRRRCAKKADKLLKIFIVLWIMKKDILQEEKKNQTLFLEPFESASKEE